MYREKGGKNPKFLAHRVPEPFCLQWNDKNRRVFFYLTQSTIVVLIPYRFLLRQEGIKTNFEEKKMWRFSFGEYSCLVIVAVCGKDHSLSIGWP